MNEDVGGGGLHLKNDFKIAPRCLLTTVGPPRLASSIPADRRRGKSSQEDATVLVSLVFFSWASHVARAVFVFGFYNLFLFLTPSHFYFRTLNTLKNRHRHSFSRFSRHALWDTQRMSPVWPFLLLVRGQPPAYRELTKKTGQRLDVETPCAGDMSRWSSTCPRFVLSSPARYPLCNGGKKKSFMCDNLWTILLNKDKSRSVRVSCDGDINDEQDSWHQWPVALTQGLMSRRTLLRHHVVFTGLIALMFPHVRSRHRLASRRILCLSFTAAEGQKLFLP